MPFCTSPTVLTKTHPRRTLLLPRRWRTKRIPRCHLIASPIRLEAISTFFWMVLLMYFVFAVLFMSYYLRRGLSMWCSILKPGYHHKYKMVGGGWSKSAECSMVEDRWLWWYHLLGGQRIRRLGIVIWYAQVATVYFWSKIYGVSSWGLAQTSGIYVIYLKESVWQISHKLYIGTSPHADSGQQRNFNASTLSILLCSLAKSQSTT